MNKLLQKYARQQLINGLGQCTEGQVLIFKRMYAFKHLDWNIEKVIEAMPDEKLDRAMEQVEATLKKAAISKATE